MSNTPFHDFAIANDVVALKRYLMSVKDAFVPVPRVETTTTRDPHLCVATLQASFCLRVARLGLQTPLELAVRNNCVDVVRWLAPRVPITANWLTKDLLEIAAANNFEECVVLLQSCGLTSNARHPLLQRSVVFVWCQIDNRMATFVRDAARQLINPGAVLVDLGTDWPQTRVHCFRVPVTTRVVVVPTRRASLSHIAFTSRSMRAYMQYNGASLLAATTYGARSNVDAVTIVDVSGFSTKYTRAQFYAEFASMFPLTPLPQRDLIVVGISRGRTFDRMRVDKQRACLRACVQADAANYDVNATRVDAATISSHSF